MQRVCRVWCRRPHPHLDRRWPWVALLVFLRRAGRSRLSILTSGEGGRPDREVEAGWSCVEGVLGVNMKVGFGEVWRHRERERRVGV